MEGRKTHGHLFPFWLVPSLLLAATSVAAECLMIHARTGAIRPGLEADLIVVGRDPTADLEALRDVLFVLNDGKIVINRLPR